jgi:pilus assembly protein Flp/PilA
MDNALRTRQQRDGFDDESGVTAIEYGLLAALIAVTIVGALTATGTSLTDLYAAWSAAVLAAIGGAL